MKKTILFLSLVLAVVSCSKVGKGEYIISGTATGVENGKTVILQTQDPVTKAILNLDTVKVENGKFEIKGKVTEPAFHVLNFESLNGQVPFILESGEINIVVNKDSIHKSKISGTYNNDEYVKFNDEMMVLQKKANDFQKKNMEVMQKAQQSQDTATINGLMKDFMKIQEESATQSKAKYAGYAESHPKSFISVLIIQSMLNDPSADVATIEKLYNGLDESIKNTKPGTAVKTSIGQMKMPAVGASAPAVGSPQ
ncbi:DUF4369 domain-containing protein [Flavobacterium sp. TMP13]|uniref:DUF4369 domain-containing protein n=1 Tax=unclassified Flavobacterium TaxID=196869 RepID=UPI00076D5464|nr:DUF4369 domain-containing protein [Flavobacterium sp. TAB 87]KVV14653.1 hypothetical protein AP058_01706 [Flavobacterium sp. TAB 87]